MSIKRHKHPAYHRLGCLRLKENYHEQHLQQLKTKDVITMADKENDVNIFPDQVKCLKKGIKDMSVVACNHCNCYDTQAEPYQAIDIENKAIVMHVFCNSCGNTNILTFKLHSVEVRDMLNKRTVKDVEVIEDEPVDVECIGCGKAYFTSEGCTLDFMQEEQGMVAYERIPYNNFESGATRNGCQACGVEVGQIHHVDCPYEICPKCHDTFVTCDCKLEITPGDDC